MARRKYKLQFQAFIERVTFTEIKDGWMSHHRDMDMYGYGATHEEALSDLCAVIAEELRDLAYDRHADYQLACERVQYRA